MIRIYHYPSQQAEAKVAQIAQRDIVFRQKDLTAVNRIIKTVRQRGDQALLDYTRQFDAPKFTADMLQVTTAEFKAARQLVDRAFIRALNRATRQIQTFHENQRQRSWMSTPRPGTLLGQMVNPVDAAGVYVPGGRGGQTPLISSVLMNVIPAKIAGVPQIVMVTPPKADGRIDPFLLVAASKVGVHKIFKVGSAWAIAALAFGTESVPKVDVIAGPGNIYVTLAKKIVSGSVGIDMIAGPSEVLIIADDQATPEYVAADLLSQAEHDQLASAVLLTTSKPLAQAVAAEITSQLPQLSRADIARASLAKFGAAVVVPDIPMALALANRMAPEHLELHIRNPFDCVGQIRNAGAVFVGDFTPEPVGDYIAGPNHVLPTAGTARFSSALSVERFTKQTSLVHYSQEAFFEEARDITRLATVEGLDAHVNAVELRLSKK